MCALDSSDSNRDGEAMIFAPKETASQEEAAEAPAPQKKLPRTTTGVIRIMRAKGRLEVAGLVEELHSTEQQVVETTQLAKDLLRLLRMLKRKATGTFQTITVHDSAGEDA